MNVPDPGHLLRDSSRSGVYHAPQQGLEELLEAARHGGLAIFDLDLAGVADKAALMQKMADALRFPDWFGHNWDALADGLGDLSWLGGEAEGWLLLLRNCDELREGLGEEFATLLQVFAAAAESWREAQMPFWVLIDMRADGIAWLPTLLATTHPTD